MIKFLKKLWDAFVNFLFVEVDIQPGVMGFETPAVEEPAKSPKAEVAAKRSRSKGKFVGDDKSTTEVNEAYKDGVKPPKKSKPKKKPDLKVQD